MGKNATDYCIKHPDREAIVWCGHVLERHTQKKLMAGWCSDECRKDSKMADYKGFCGNENGGRA